MSSLPLGFPSLHGRGGGSYSIGLLWGQMSTEQNSRKLAFICNYWLDEGRGTYFVRWTYFADWRAHDPGSFSVANWMNRKLNGGVYGHILCMYVCIHIPMYTHINMEPFWLIAKYVIYIWCNLVGIQNNVCWMDKWMDGFENEWRHRRLACGIQALLP